MAGIVPNGNFSFQAFDFLFMRIFLLGFMGSGKSHTGKRLARLTDQPFIDLDHWLEQQQQCDIPAIFEAEGEIAFREIERSALHAMTQFENAIIACGGGTPCFFDNIDWMNQHGITVYLDTPIDILVKRLKSERSHRPLLKNLSESELYPFIEKKLTDRLPYYQKAQITYKTSAAKENTAILLHQNIINIIGH